MSLRCGMKRRSSCALEFPHILVRHRPDATPALSGLLLSRLVDRPPATDMGVGVTRARAALPTLLWCDIPPLGRTRCSNASLSRRMDRRLPPRLLAQV